MNDTPSTPKITKILWMNAVEGFTPHVEADEHSPHMAFRCADAQSELGATTALFGAYNFGWPYLPIYGGQFPAPINVVAIDTATGDVYFNPAYHSDASKQKTVTLLSDNLSLIGREPEFDRTFVNESFNADMARLLDLPPKGGTYNVLLWLDDLVTPVQTVTVPKNDNRPEFGPFRQFNSPHPSINLGKSTHSPSPTPGEIRIDGPIPSARNRLYATLPEDAIGKLRESSESIAPVLTILGFMQKSRRFFWYSDTQIFEKMSKTGDGCFDFDPFQVVEMSDLPENVFVVAVLGNLRSEGIWIPADVIT